MPDDVLLNKVAIIRRCLVRIGEEYQGQPDRLVQLVIQDSVVLNLQRACEAAIDLSMHAVASRGLGLPQDARDAFSLLCRHGLIDAALQTRMQAMVGFRNLAVHEYQKLQVPILVSILDRHLGDFVAFADRMLTG
jgi:uncharacterized protein YutE (UPF0331/DUF86 family)